MGRKDYVGERCGLALLILGGDDPCTRMSQERFQFHPILHPVQVLFPLFSMEVNTPLLTGVNRGTEIRQERKGAEHGTSNN